MHHLYWQKSGLVNGELAVFNFVYLNAGNPGIFVVLENICELPFQLVQYSDFGINRYGSLLPEIKSANVVQPGSMILVLMSEYYPIQVNNSFPKHLLAEIRPRIHDKTIAIGLYVN